MGYMTNKFKGTYRLKAPIDESIMDFARDFNGKYAEDDVYIDCKYGMIYQYSGQTMEAWVGDLKGKESRTTKLKSMLKKNAGVKFDKNGWPVYPKECIVSDIILGDGEGSFRFNVKNTPLFASEMGAKTSGKNISPFSKKNLPKEKYNIPEEDLKKVKQPISGMELIDILALYKDFGSQNSVEPNKVAIHKRGLWDALVEFLVKNSKIS